MGYANRIKSDFNAHFPGVPENTEIQSGKAIFMVHAFPVGLASAAPRSGQLLFCSHGKRVGVQ